MGSNRKWRDRKWHDRKWHQSHDRKWHVRTYVLHMRNRKWAIPALVGLLTGSDKVTWPEVSLTGRRFCACPVFPRVFFLVVVTWLPKVTWLLRGSLWVYATGSCATSVVTEGHVISWKCPWVFSTTSASYNPRKPRVLYLVTGTSPGYLPPLLFSHSV